MNLGLPFVRTVCLVVSFLNNEANDKAPHCSLEYWLIFHIKGVFRRRPVWFPSCEWRQGVVYWMSYLFLFSKNKKVVTPLGYWWVFLVAGFFSANKRWKGNSQMIGMEKSQSYHQTEKGIVSFLQWVSFFYQRKRLVKFGKNKAFGFCITIWSVKHDCLLSLIPLKSFQWHEILHRELTYELCYYVC